MLAEALRNVHLCLSECLVPQLPLHSPHTLRTHIDIPPPRQRAVIDRAKESDKGAEVGPIWIIGGGGVAHLLFQLLLGREPRSMTLKR